MTGESPTYSGSSRRCGGRICGRVSPSLCCRRNKNYKLSAGAPLRGTARSPAMLRHDQLSPDRDRCVAAAAAAAGRGHADAFGGPSLKTAGVNADCVQAPLNGATGVRRTSEHRTTNRQHPSRDDSPGDMREDYETVLCSVVYNNCTQWRTFT